jgi:anti-anti-sigma regulatory factor/uncharacterized protein (DUF433 family)
MSPKYHVESDESAFSVLEESGFFRLSMKAPDIGPKHVEDFLDTTVEWLSGNPTKGILIDFEGVRSVSDDFVAHLLHEYEEIKARGLYVRFVNVDPAIEPYMESGNITVVISPEMLRIDKPILSARQILKDLAADMSDEELMHKHGLSQKGLKSMFKKLLQKGLITEKALAKRWGLTTGQLMIAVDSSGTKKVRVPLGDLITDLASDLPDEEIMSKYQLSAKALGKLTRQLYQQGLVTKELIDKRAALKGTV